MELRLVLRLGSGRAAHTPLWFSPSTNTSPWFCGISSLGFLTTKITDEVRTSSWEAQAGLCGTLTPMDGQGKGGTNGIDASHQQNDPLSAKGSQNIQHYKGSISGVQPKTQGLERET